jgi:hypothetical protein
MIVWIICGVVAWSIGVVFCYALSVAAARGDRMGGGVSGQPVELGSSWRSDEWPYDDDPPDPL